MPMNYSSGCFRYIGLFIIVVGLTLTRKNIFSGFRKVAYLHIHLFSSIPIISFISVSYNLAV